MRSRDVDFATSPQQPMTHDGLFDDVRSAPLLASLLVGVSLGLAIGRGATADTPKSSQPPNIVLIVVDTSRVDHFSTYGASRATTPHVDALAQQSVVYLGAHSVAPWTLPSHWSMFTGLLPGEHGAHWGAFSESEHKTIRQMMGRRFTIEDDSRLLPQRLREAGYTTIALSGNGWISSQSGFSAGFGSRSSAC